MRSRLLSLLPFAGHAALTLTLFSGPVLEGRMPYFRDLAFRFFPDYTFIERALAGRTWPWWHPGTDAGAPFLVAYLPDVVSIFLVGAAVTLRIGPALHVLLAMRGMSRLASRLGAGRAGAWAAGTCFGACGVVLSLANLLPLLQGAAWAPWVVDASLGCMAQPDRRSAARLALFGALQASTLAAEIVLQTVLAAIFLWPSWPSRRAWRALIGALSVASLLLLPVVAGLSALLAGSARAHGFAPDVVLGWSLAMPVLAGAVIPRFLGSMHTATSVGLWGQRFFPDGFPYLVSLYCGPVVTALALGAWRVRGWAMVVVGVVLAAAPAPVAALLIMAPFLRTPVKFLFLSAFGMALLVGWAASPGARRWLSGAVALAAGGLLLAVGSALSVGGPVAASVSGLLVAAVRDPTAEPVIRGAWPAAFIPTGALTLAAGLALLRPRLAQLALWCAVLDLLIVNLDVNRSAQPQFYALAPGVRALIDASRDGSRWFSYGLVNARRAVFAPPFLLANDDVWLYWLDRQALSGLAKVLDRLDGVFDEDRTGWSPPGATLLPWESDPRALPLVAPRLRLASVRWILSFDELGSPPAQEIGRTLVPGVLNPLRLYRLEGALPRAWWVPGVRIMPRAAIQQAVTRGTFDPRAVALVEPATVGDCPACGAVAPGDASGNPEPLVRLERPSPQHIRLRATTPPGLLIVTEGWHGGWRATRDGAPVPVMKVDGRYIGLPTPGGSVTIDLEYSLPGLTASLAAAGLGGLALLSLFLASGGVRSAGPPQPPRDGSTGRL